MANNLLTSNTVSLNELYTLKEVYEIEFGVRGYWKCIFDNSPIKYKKKAMIVRKKHSNGLQQYHLVKVYLCC